jgi:phosphatidylglycerophosphate synthase
MPNTHKIMEQQGKQSQQGRSLLDRIADGLLLLSVLIMAAILASVAWFVFFLLSHGGE